MSNGCLLTIGGKYAVWACRQAGYVVDRVVGSRHILAHTSDAHLGIVVPRGRGRDLKPKTLRAIFRQAGLTVDEFDRLLRKPPKQNNSIVMRSPIRTFLRTSLREPTFTNPE